MTFDEWFNEIELFSSRDERFFSDLDHHKEGSKGSYDRMVNWLETAYTMGQEHALNKLLDDGK